MSQAIIFDLQSAVPTQNINYLEKIIIAIDGHSSCGKSTLAKALAHRLQYSYIDSGAMYRAVTLHLIRQGISANDTAAVTAELPRIHIAFAATPDGNATLLNGENVEQEIRKMYVSELVSPVAAISAVRTDLVAKQRAMGQQKGIIMDGRDIGTVVFPHAALKIFLTASPQERARRRFAELQAKGIPAELDAIAHNLQQRDHIDSTRADSPLRQAADAIVIDNTHLSEEKQLEAVMALVQERLPVQH